MKKHILIFSVLLFLIYSCAKEPSQRIIIQSENAPTAIGPYSQAIMVGNTLYAAGQIGLVPGTGEMAGEDLESQARQTLNNLQAVLEESGFTMKDVVSVDVYLSDINDYSSFNKIYAEYFSESKPARGVVGFQESPEMQKSRLSWWL